MAKLQVLYKEERSGGEYNAYDGYQDKVRVELRKWSSKSTKRTDYILSTFVLVDGEAAVDNTKVLNGATDSRAIRQAVTKFDNLLESHPTLGKPQPEPADAEPVSQDDDPYGLNRVCACSHTRAWHSDEDGCSRCECRGFHTGRE